MNEMNRRWADAMFTTIGGSNDVDRARFSGAFTTVLQSAQWLPRSRVRRIIGVKGMRRVESTQSCQRSLARSEPELPRGLLLAAIERLVIRSVPAINEL